MLRRKMGVSSAALAGVNFTLLFLTYSAPSAPVPQQSYATDMQLQAKRSAVDFVPDGNLSKPAWRHATSVEFDSDASGTSHHTDISTRVASLWTEKYIYFAFWCRYDSLNVYQGEDPKAERWQLWDRDVAEVFLNPQPERINHYYEFEVAPNNQWVDLEIDKTKEPFNDVTWNSGFEHAVHIDQKHHIWTVEMRIPLSSMNVTSIHSGSQWRANFFRTSGKGTDVQRKFLAWSIIPDGKTFHVPSRFGVLRLVN